MASSAQPFGAMQLVDTSGLDQGLMRILRDAEVSEDVIDAVTFPNGRPMQLKTLTEFYFAIDKRNLHESVMAFLNTVPLLRRDTARIPMEHVRICAAHSVAVRAWDHIQENRSDAQQEPETPLPDRVKLRLEQQFKKIYNFVPVGWLRPGEKTQARMYRMLQPGGHKEVFPIEVLKSLERTTKVVEKPTSVQLAAGYALTHKDEKDKKVVDIFDYYCRLKIWAYAMAWAGSDMVQGQWGECRQCPLDVFMEYAEDAYKKAQKTPDPLKWIRERDEQTRAKMISYMQDPDSGLPAGKALQAARKELHNLWDISKETAKIASSASAAEGISKADFIRMAKSLGLQARAPLGKTASALAKKARANGKGKKAKRKGDGKGRGAGKGNNNKRWVDETKSGKKFCPDFQYGTCTNPNNNCPKGLHLCNRKTSKGIHCGCMAGYHNCTKTS